MTAPEDEVRVTVRIREADFERLTRNSMEWAAIPDWKDQAPARFERVEGPYDAMPRFDWTMAYWVGEDYAAVLLVKAYLDAHGEPCEVVWDMAENPPGMVSGYLVLTNYVTATWRDIRERIAAERDAP